MPQLLHVIAYIRFELWQLTLHMVWYLQPVVVDAIVPGQYRQFDVRLQSRLVSVIGVRSILVEALTKWSDRFLFLREPNIILKFVRKRVVFDFSKRDQFDVTMSLSGGFLGLCVVTR